MSPSIVASLVTIAFMAVVAVGVRLLLGEHLLTLDWRTFVFYAGTGIIAAILWVSIYRGRQGNSSRA
ncbi:MAG TPA: hypothetical protein VGR26_05580 [Acidimicrobiales bacterium]|nr:hypothetical protein [Acidimicrobiales bacterium]